MATLYYSLGKDGWTNCPSERRWFGDNDGDDGGDDDDNGAGVGSCDGGAAQFLDASHECAWFGILCGPGSSSPDPSGADAHQPVAEIHLRQNDLRGAVPIEFYQALGGCGGGTWRATGWAGR